MLGRGRLIVEDWCLSVLAGTPVVDTLVRLNERSEDTLGCAGPRCREGTWREESTLASEETAGAIREAATLAGFVVGLGWSFPEGPSGLPASLNGEVECVGGVVSESEAVTLGSRGVTEPVFFNLCFGSTSDFVGVLL